MSKAKSIQSILIRFFWFLFFSIVIITSCILVENNQPYPLVYSDDGFNWEYTPTESVIQNSNITFDQHSHTLYSDGKLTPRQNILWHIAHGFNAFALTDHQTIEGALEARNIARSEYNDTIKVIIGMEWTTAKYHLNFLGIKNWTWDIPSEPTPEQTIAAINEVHNQGGVVTVNHLLSSYAKRDQPERDVLESWGVDYFEIVNGGTYDENSDIFTDSSPVAKITGTDMHSPKKVSCWTALNVSEFTEDAILEQLVLKNTLIVYNETGSIDYSLTTPSLPNKLLSPMIKIGEIFKDYDLGSGEYDWAGIGIFLAYLVGVFIISEIIRVSNRKFWEKRNYIDETSN